MVQTGHEVVVAFSLNIAAGFATVLGGFVIFHKRLVHLANPLSLAVALSVSAGVMMFISLVEIFGESVSSFKHAIKSDDMTEDTATGHGWLAATACCTVGILLIYVIDMIVTWISPAHEATEMENLEHLRESFSNQESEYFTKSRETPGNLADLEAPSPVPVVVNDNTVYMKMDEMAKRNLQRMGVLSALAIGIHNIPEGIATYAGSVQNSSVGFSLAVGIGLHNIPEGIAVAAPIYFATGSRARGLLWCFLSAIAEPLGGVIAWLAIGDGLTHMSEGILYGLVCGIMMCIVVKELLPTAFRFAREKTQLVTLGMFFGMFVMVLSLTLFGYAGV
jgi:ZIP family zinc transporter